MVKQIGIIGAGGWGTCLALILHRKNCPVMLWEAFPGYAEFLRRKRENVYYLPGIRLPRDLCITDRMKQVLDNSDFLIVTVPTQHLRSVLRKVKKGYRNQALLLGTKGLELATGKTVGILVKEELGKVPWAILSGPTIARELAQGHPAAAVIAAEQKSTAALFQKILSSEIFRLYTNTDVVGVELGGALKNVIAIGAGIIDGLKLGINTKAAYLTRGLKEIVRIGVRLGGREKTFQGLSGLGDLVTTCFSPHSRNRSFGQALVETGKEQYLKQTKMVVEGYFTLKSLHSLARKLKVDLPITETLYRIVYLNRDVNQEIARLMTRQLKEE